MNSLKLAGKTAISRKKLSRPMQYLLDSGKLSSGRILDFGCGRGDDVTRLQAQGLDIEGYDPNHCQSKLDNGYYDVITCNYVLNVIESEEVRASVLNTIKSLLTYNGVAYITVRDDREYLKGTTSKGTWQGLVELDLPITKASKGSYVMYELKNRI
jgi:DNA phosphorothioation-associated putative methyltransferase